MVIPRVAGHGTLLTDGTVLVVGEDTCLIAGANEGSERTEVYDPVADRWTEVGSLNKPRSMLSLVARPDGTAMVLGGLNSADAEYSSTKVYGPDEQAWSNGPLMARAGAVGAVTLSDGRIVAARTGDTEILDAGATQWRQSTPPPRGSVVSSLFAVGDDLVGALGGRDEDGSDVAAVFVFDPRTEQWEDVGTPDGLPDTAVGLPDGSILVFGEDEGGSRISRYDAARARWVRTAQLAIGRTRQQLTVLPDGRVLVAGGVALISRGVDDGYSVTEGRVLKGTELYDPTADRWTAGPPLLGTRQGGLAIPLSDGSVMILGGFRRMPPDPNPGDTGTPGPCPDPLASTERLVLRP